VPNYLLMTLIRVSVARGVTVTMHASKLKIRIRIEHI
jgi:hypothetical protein